MRSLAIFLQLLLVFYYTPGKTDAAEYVERLMAAKYDNPNYVRDRHKKEMYKPQFDYGAFSSRFKKPYHPAWQDYCDPYHCNDYYKIACGLNRKTMRFQWFQSNCHIILNNQCANFRGALKYDRVDNKYCTVYVMHLRSGCPECNDDVVAPVCAVSTVTSRVMIFKNRCAMDKANCEEEKPEYEEVRMFLCDFYLKYLVK